MEINIQSVHFDADKKLIGFINEKVNKLGTFYNGIMNSEIILRIDKDSKAGNKVAEIRIKGKSHEFFAKKQCQTFEEATDLACEALRSQVQKFKDKSS